MDPDPGGKKNIRIRNTGYLGPDARIIFNKCQVGAQRLAACQLVQPDKVPFTSVSKNQN